MFASSFCRLYLPGSFSIHARVNLPVELMLQMQYALLFPQHAPQCPSPNFSPFLHLIDSPENRITCSAQVGLVVMGMHD